MVAGAVGPRQVRLAAWQAQAERERCQLESGPERPHQLVGGAWRVHCLLAVVGLGARQQAVAAEAQHL